MTREDGGIKYYGMWFGGFNRLPSQLALTSVEKGSDAPSINKSLGWKTMFETFKSVYSIPGMITEKDSLFNGNNRFVKDKNVAIFPDILLSNALMASLKEGGTQWDIASFPVFPDKPKTGIGTFAGGFVIPEGAKNKEESFKAILALLSENLEKKRTMYLTKQEAQDYLNVGYKCINDLLSKEVITFSNDVHKNLIKKETLDQLLFNLNLVTFGKAIPSIFGVTDGDVVKFILSKEIIPRGKSTRRGLKSLLFDRNEVSEFFNNQVKKSIGELHSTADVASILKVKTTTID
ncbi:MAG: family 1 extracellular solute-binding protein, partial [Paenibacillus sp.]|nr:family 1 extracellular solute-binding protein [Paenibacillus sp.]